MFWNDAVITSLPHIISRGKLQAQTLICSSAIAVLIVMILHFLLLSAALTKMLSPKTVNLFVEILLHNLFVQGEQRTNSYASLCCFFLLFFGSLSPFKYRISAGCSFLNLLLGMLPKNNCYYCHPLLHSVCKLVILSAGLRNLIRFSLS